MVEQVACVMLDALREYLSSSPDRPIEDDKAQRE
jgi:hypothetical protein